MQVYIVTEGEYDDYRILGVFITRENAEAHCCPEGCAAKRLCWPNGSPMDCRVEEWEADKGKPHRYDPYGHHCT